MSQDQEQQPQVQEPVPPAIQAKFTQAIAAHQQGKFADAERLYREILDRHPNHFGATQMLGVIALQAQQPARAAELLRKAIALNANAAAPHSNLGKALLDLGHAEEALANFDRAIALKPDLAEAHHNRALALKYLNRSAEALPSYDQAIALNPGFVAAYYNRGNALSDLKRPQQALASFNKAVELKPDFAAAYNNRGLALNALKRHEEALASYDRAIGLNPNFAEAYINRGVALRDLKRPEQVLASYNKAIALRPDYDFFYGLWLHTKMIVCEWSNLESEIAGLTEKIKRGEKATLPFPFLSMAGSPDLQRKAAAIWTLANCPPNRALPEIPKRPRRDKIRIGYFSADFYDHATARLMAELFELHDKTRFELIAFSFGPDKNDDLRQRVSAAFDKFIDVQDRSDEDIAMLAREHEIDIAVDLSGFSAEGRTGIFSFRAAPIQVNYLVYPGTMAAGYIDYLIADSILIPESHQSFYSEKIVYLPNSYQVNDSKRPIAAETPSRAEAGLPDGAFVFSCFNNNYKITPSVFDGWMRILKQVEASVLWLFADNAAAAANLRKEAAARGVDPERLVFAERMFLPDHLARHRLADLFLDTLPYNAHTTASDALWAGLPVLTQIGEAFASRVAASLLTAVGLPELIASTPQAYEDLAVELATNPARLTAIKHKLAANRLTTALFDTPLYARHIEAAYIAVYERYQMDLPPDNIHVRQ